MSDLDHETQKLRARQGLGARYDASSAPARELTWARRGTAYFARQLNNLADDELDAPSLIAGWSRRKLIGHIGHHARDLARIVEAARTGNPWVPPTDEEHHAAENAHTLPARALRNLFFHSEVHLNVEWRDLTDADWPKTVDVAGLSVAVAATPATRARAVWIHAVNLGTMGTLSDFPPDFRAWLEADEATATTKSV